ncbi:MAG: PrsW family intramembrane metalloprotease [Rhodothermales bacterium]|nr:PrsW family intramembrane metalloprotease [Rhodothermales bacterium]
MDGFRLLIELGLSIVPVVTFLLSLVLLDSYKLLSLRNLLIAITGGALVAIASYFVNVPLLNSGVMSGQSTIRYLTPLVEEIGKALVCVLLFRLNRIGFMVDAAIYGFAIGAGFACVENVYFIHATVDANMMTWLVRGFGTAIMHGGATAIYCVITRYALDRWSKTTTLALLPGLVVAYVLHSTYNHFVLPPVPSALLLLIVLPIVMIAVFQQSERLTRDWLGVGFDTDQELLGMILAGEVSDSKVGHYLDELRSRFSGEVVLDMMCWLRLHLELAIEAKGLLMMRQAGFSPEPSKAAKAKFAEISYLEKSIGKTGLLAIAPFVHTSNRELWQLYMLGKS